jgi:tetratricopeptide (TPR) repeat protein
VIEKSRVQTICVPKSSEKSTGNFWHGRCSLYREHTLRKKVLMATSHHAVGIITPQILADRARRHRRRGESRRALVVLREASLRDEESATLWTLYGAWLAEDGKNDDARRAFRHALWLRNSAGESEKARVTRALLDSVVAA